MRRALARIYSPAATGETAEVATARKYVCSCGDRKLHFIQKLLQVSRNTSYQP